MWCVLERYFSDGERGELYGPFTGASEARDWAKLRHRKLPVVVAGTVEERDTKSPKLVIVQLTDAR